MTANGRTGWLTGVLAIASLLGACGDDGVGTESITREDVTGAYAAVTFTTTTDGTTTDQLAEGASLDLTLHEDGGTTGRLFIPGGDEGAGDLTADLAGTFTFDDRTDRVTLDQTADTFLRDMAFSAVRSRGSVQLEGEHMSGGTAVRVVLR